MGTNSFRLLNRRMAYVGAAFAMMLATIVPALAFADTATERSIALSNSSKTATGVSYDVSFKTASTNTGAFVIDFCDSPAINTTCNTPSGLDVTTPTTTGSDTVAATDANTVKVTLASSVASAGGTVDVKLGGLTNPTAAGPIYARIVTYTDATAMNTGGYTNATSLGTYKDDGSVALSITDSIGVTGLVKETMTFCVSSATIAADCAGATLNPLKLGNGSGALDSAGVYTGDVYTQISTNASLGAVISLKSSTLGCGGLKRAGAPAACDITPALSGSITAGQAKFGVKAAADTDPSGGGVTPTGTFQAESAYGGSDYYMGYNAANSEAAGVTSVYGDPMLNTNSLPVNNKNMKMTFGASVSNTTPAGLYSADLSLIATGKF